MPLDFIQTCKRISVPVFCVLLAACQSAPPSVVPGNENERVIAPARTVTPQPSADIAEGSPTQAGIEEIPIVYTNLWERIRAGFKLQAFYDHAEVELQLRNYQGNQRFFDLVASRAEPFLFGIVTEIEKRNLPMELALLPAVESTFNARAHSSENAVGLWQIVGSTGRSLGLQQDWWYDARRDPRSATVAALDYLQTLYQRFDSDWMLALAAYNTGPGNVLRAQRNRASEEQQFWSLPLALETQSHVPRLLALARIVAEPDAYGIELAALPNNEPLIRVDIGSQIDLARVADLLEMDDADLRALNPGYLQWATHPDAPQTVAIPADREELLEKGLATLDSSEFVTWQHYEIRPGDTLIAIARRLNTTVDVLRVVNRLQGSRIVAGESLLIPRGTGASDYAALTLPTMAPNRTQPVPARYTVRSGDNLWSIARRFDLHSREIAAWNSISLNGLLHPGQTLDLSFAQAQTLALDTESAAGQPTRYTVVRGDSPARIAQMFGLDLSDFLRWNNLSSSSIIYPGQVVYVSESEQRFN